MKVDIVTVCVDYDDFLSVTVPTWKRFTNSITVITTPEDKKAQDLCEKESLKCVLSSGIHKDGLEFNKNVMLNDGLRTLDNPEWIWLLDGDIYLERFPDIDFNSLDKERIHQARRRMFEYYNQWKEAFANKETYDKIRIIYYCWGYFQLFHTSASAIKNSKCGIFYDEKATDEISKHGDREFQRRFVRQSIFEECVDHLGLPRVNWFGRKTKRWGL